jgi:hypothetical protein
MAAVKGSVSRDDLRTSKIKSVLSVCAMVVFKFLAVLLLRKSYLNF